MKRKFELISIFLISLLVLGLNFPTQAEKISKDLSLRLEQIDDFDYQSCILIPKVQSDTDFLKYKLSKIKPSRKLRHNLVINWLKQNAESSQSDLLQYLEEKKRDGSVADFRSFWITNAISLIATKEQIRSIVQRSDVEIIYPDYPISLIDPVSDPQLSLQDLGDRSLDAIGVREVWRMGYTGKGRLVCSFDTGVEGMHPALMDSWRGNNGGNLSCSWLDPYNSTYPYDLKGHGTHTMGIMVGKTEQDTTGVAFNAQWICAGVVDRGKDFSSTISDILSAFEWAVDPDGNPETLDDVPDVINNSWGIPLLVHQPCEQTFWQAIDNVEAAGVVTIFAAGNEGPDSMTIRTPADRISSPYNTFSVGAVDANTFSYPVADFSSRGPSGCDSVTIKPEVCAPGVKVNSTYLNGSYRLMSGTSMAAPFVSGAVGILREYNPEATVEEIKQALISSASDLGPAGEDNAYGWGLINVKKALELLTAPSCPSVYLDSFYLQIQTYTSSLDTANLCLSLGNWGQDVEGVTITLISDDSMIQVNKNYSFLGDIVSGATLSNHSDPFVISYDPNLAGNYVARFTLSIFGDSPPYSKEIKFSIPINENTVFSTGDHDIGNFEFTISNFGSYGLSNWSFNPMGGRGFIYPEEGMDNLYEGALILGTDVDQVSDGARDSTGSKADEDFKPIPDQILQIINPGEVSDQDGIATFTDSNSLNPMGVKIIQKSLCWDDPGEDSYLILEYSLENISSQSIEDFYIGLLFDWDIPLSSPDDDKVGVDASLNLTYQYDFKESIYLGIAPLTAPVKAIQPVDNSLWLYNGFTKEEKYKFLSGEYNFFPDTSAGDWSQIVSAGPFNIPVGQKVKAAFVIAGGRTLEELKDNVSKSKIKYDQCVTDVEDDYAPDPAVDFHLGQNYPNPFNPATTIPFSVNSSQSTVNSPIHTTLSIYNVLGQRVKTLLDEKKQPGKYEVVWDGRDEKGNQVSSGVYLYRIQVGKFVQVKKMVVLK